MASRFRRAFKKLMPSWLTTGEGELVHFSLGIVIDAFAERWRQGVLARFPTHGPEDALAASARDRKIIRGINESAEDFALRLLPWLDDHKKRGNPYALLEKLRAYCGPGVRVRTVDARGNWYTIDRDGTRTAELDTGTWEWDAMDPARWSRFWVIIYPTSDGVPWEITPDTIGDPGLWGGVLAGPELTVGTTATPEQVSKVRTIIRDWQPDGTRCEWVIVAFDDSSFDPTAPEPDGTWAGFGMIDGSDDMVVARLDTARYWRGASGALYP